MSAVGDNYEEALWSNSFYSSQDELTLLSLSNHIHNLKRSVNIPHLILTNLVRTGLLEDIVTPATNRTLLMLISPSMKALESVLNNKSPTRKPEMIVEEPEAREVYRMSVQTFPTARSFETVEAHQRHSSSSTIGDTGYSTDNTPQLHQPASFFTVKHTSKDYSPQLKTFASTFPEKEVDSTDTKVCETEMDIKDEKAVKSRETPQNTNERRSNEHETKEQDLGHAPGHASTIGAGTMDPGRVSTISAEKGPTQLEHANGVHGVNEKAINSIAQTTREKRHSVHLMEVSPPTAIPSKTSKSPTPPVQSLLDTSPGTDSPKLEEPFRPHKNPDVPPTNDTCVASKKDSSVFATPRSLMGRPSLDKKPSHVLGRKGNNETKNEKGKQGTPRSSTMGDLAGASKRFSFRGFFKIKPKDHSHDKITEPSIPSKIKGKSFSTPNFGEFNKSKLDRNRKSIFGKRKKDPEPNAAREPKITSKVQSIPETPKITHMNEVNPGTIREVDDLDYLPGFNADDSFDGKKSDYGKTQTTSSLGKSPRFGSTPNISSSNTPRIGVTSDFLNVVRSDSISFEDDLPRRHDGMYGEEIALEPEMSQRSQKKLGLPLDVSPVRSPRIVLPPPSPFKERKTDQLLGETLFPKSLNAHEVESIVSLERSRSMRSLRSNGKRSSFINYTGSDENVVLGEALSHTSSMRRSGSILKGSLLMKSVRVPVLIDATMGGETTEGDAGNGTVIENEKASTANIESLRIPDTEINIARNFDNIPIDLDKDMADADIAKAVETIEKDTEDANVPRMQHVPSEDTTEVDIHDFMEFSNFIDADILDFSMSPRPVLEVSLPSLVSTPDKVEKVPTESPKLSQLTVQSGLHPALDSLTDSVLEYASREGTRSEKEVTTNTETKPLPDLPELVESDTNSEELEEPILLITVTSTISESNERPIEQSPILDAACKMAVPLTLRPVLMSFKGFSGSTLTQAGPGVHIDETVGQGFGSDSDSDSDIENFDTHERRSPPSTPEFKQNGSVSNRKLHTRKPLGLQPPSFTGSFHHDRIPSLSDHSAASSPRSLSSFISRMKRSPMASPKIMASPRVFKPGVRFSSRIVLYDTYNGDEYDRFPEVATCNQLTPQLAQQIKDELNEFKSEMRIHRDSQCYTHFF